MSFTVRFVYWFGVFMLCIAAFGIGVDVQQQQDYSNSIFEAPTPTKPLSEAMLANKCADPDIEKVAECLVNTIKPHFKYRRNSDTNILTFNQLLNGGGDCKDWSMMYVDVAKKMGIETDFVRFQTGERTGHRFAFIANSQAYCIIDQKVYHCQKIGGNRQ